MSGTLVQTPCRLCLTLSVPNLRPLPVMRFPSSPSGIVGALSVARHYFWFLQYCASRRSHSEPACTKHAPDRRPSTVSPLPPAASLSGSPSATRVSWSLAACCNGRSRECASTSWAKLFSLLAAETPSPRTVLPLATAAADTLASAHTVNASAHTSGNARHLLRHGYLRGRWPCVLHAQRAGRCAKPR